MHTLHLYRALIPVDLKNIRRDSLLMWIPLMPFMVALLYRLAIPKLTLWASTEFNADLTTIYPLLMSAFILLVPLLAGMIIGFLLLDERDDRVLTALMVTPMPMSSYLFYRLSLPVVLGVIMTIVCYPIAGLVPLSLGELILMAGLMSLSAPILALVLATFASNKVVGFTVMKLINGVLMIPTVAYFSDSVWAHLAGILPTFWALKAFWLLADGDSTFLIYYVIGIIAHLLALWLLLRRFNTILHQ